VDLISPFPQQNKEKIMHLPIFVHFLQDDNTRLPASVEINSNIEYSEPGKTTIATITLNSDKAGDLVLAGLAAADDQCLREGTFDNPGNALKKLLQKAFMKGVMFGAKTAQND
jgi:hypothetical protein